MALRRSVLERGELFSGYHPELERVHIQNGQELQSILKEFGWPDPQRFGPTAPKNAWHITIHAISLPALMREVLELVQKENLGVPASHVAMLEDRVRVLSGKRQLFGTQFDWNQEGMLAPNPIEDQESVDARRTSVGLEPLADAIARMRRQAESEGDSPPADIAQREKEYQAWRKRVGWAD